jgi:hypothetical protein
MGVYISGLEIPQEGRITLQIDSGGGVYVVNKFSITSEKYEKYMPATEIPPHGRLIDADALKTAFPTSENATNIKVSAVRRAINRMSTIIEAERNEE